MSNKNLCPDGISLANDEQASGSMNELRDNRVHQLGALEFRHQLVRRRTGNRAVG